MHRISLATAALVGAAAVAAPAHAASDYANAVAICQGALPAFEGSLRKRPLAIANEGTAQAFVSCSLPIEQTAHQGNAIVGVALVNRSAGLVAVACTMVDGTAPELIGAIPPTLYPKNIALAAGEGNSILWQATDFELDTFSKVASVSCSLPPGVEIAAMATSYQVAP